MKMTKKQITQNEMNDFLTKTRVTKLNGISPISQLYYYQFFKLDLNNKFYILYVGKQQFEADKIFMPENFEICGYVEKNTKMLYNPTARLIRILEDIREIPCIQYTDFTDLNFNNVLSEKVTQEIKNNWEELRNEKYKNYFTDIDFLKKNKARNLAIEWVVENELFEAPEYVREMTVNMKEEDYIEYLSDPENYLNKQIDQIFKQKNNLSSFYSSIIVYESAKEQMKEIMENPDIQNLRRIKKSLKDLEDKYNSKISTVSLKVLKDNNEWIGKVSIRALKNCGVYTAISMYDFSKQDRDSFKKLFGRSEYLYYEDIDEIIFRNKIIYKKGE